MTDFDPERFQALKCEFLDVCEANMDLDPAQVFGQMIQLAVNGLYDMAPDIVVAQAVINISLQNGLDDYMDQFGDDDEPTLKLVD